MLQGFHSIPTLEKSANNISVPVLDPIPLPPLDQARRDFHILHTGRDHSPCHQEAVTEEGPSSLIISRRGKWGRLERSWKNTSASGMGELRQIAEQIGWAIYSQLISCKILFSPTKDTLGKSGLHILDHDRAEPLQSHSLSGDNLSLQRYLKAQMGVLQMQFQFLRRIGGINNDRNPSEAKKTEGALALKLLCTVDTQVG